MAEKPLRVFLWTDVFCDYTCGMAVVVARTAKEAFEKLAERENACFHYPKAKAIEELLVQRGVHLEDAIELGDAEAVYVAHGGS